MLWDIFCKVIDNHGDIGVCWRLAVQLARRGERVRLWVDDASALAWMAPLGEPGVEVIAWGPGVAFAAPGEVVVEAFGCALDDAFIAAIAGRFRATGHQPAWINLEYLTAESYASRAHRLPSPVMRGPGAGLTKHFFYPGFTPLAGGLLHEVDLAQRQAVFDRAGWLRSMGVDAGAGRVVSLFCYEPAALGDLLGQLADAHRPTTLLVTAGRATAAVQAALSSQNALEPASGGPGTLSIFYLPLLGQDDFDHVLWASDFNFVRGEDSLVRALWAGKPFAWQLYPQHDGAHGAKLEAFLDWLQATPAERQFYSAWNGLREGPLPALESVLDATTAQAARTRLAGQADLAAQLLDFAGHLRAGPEREKR